MLASPWFRDPASMYAGMRMGRGQFIRWVDPMVEESGYHANSGDRPSVDSTLWLQRTASPPNVVDVDGDGHNEVVGIPNAEEHAPVVTQAFAFMVRQGARGDGALSARRPPAFETLPMSEMPATRANDDDDPPSGVPAPTTVNILGDARPEIIAPVDDGYIYAVSPDGERCGASTTRAAPRRPLRPRSPPPTSIATASPS